MSSRTPKLDLVLPVGGEHVSRAIINENNTKIDNGFGTLSEQMVNLVGNWDAWVSNVDLNDYKTTGVYALGSNLTNSPGTYAILNVSAAKSNTVKQTASISDKTYVREFRNDVWSSWKQLVTKDDTIFARAVTAGISSGGTMYLNHTGSVILMTDRGGLWTEGTLGRTLTTIDSNANITVTRESNTKLKIVSSYTYSTQLTAFGYGEQLSFSTT